MRVLTIDDWYDGPLCGLACEELEVYFYFKYDDELFGCATLTSAEIAWYEDHPDGPYEAVRELCLEYANGDGCDAFEYEDRMDWSKAVRR